MDVTSITATGGILYGSSCSRSSAHGKRNLSLDRELLDGKQPGALMALVINGTMDKQAEMASRLRTHSMNALGKGLRMDIAI